MYWIVVAIMSVLSVLVMGYFAGRKKPLTEREELLAAMERGGWWRVDMDRWRTELHNLRREAATLLKAEGAHPSLVEAAGKGDWKEINHSLADARRGAANLVAADGAHPRIVEAVERQTWKEVNRAMEANL